MDNEVKIRVSGLSFFYGKTRALENISMDIYKNKVTAIIGPSGCGKSTFIRLFNRMNDLIPGTRVEGSIYIDRQDILGPGIDVVVLRRKVGMVFQKPNPFPKSIFRNISYGLEVNNVKDKIYIEQRVTESLQNSALFEEIKGRLNDSALMLSGGQQQRLCIARCLAVEPEVIL
ncbi:MAG TPA: ATP-binding cassette domain-containing protein, partial [bacterium]|nr:ATP-binding cassette domain-containing protein [bacterium]